MKFLSVVAQKQQSKKNLVALLADRLGGTQPARTFKTIRASMLTHEEQRFCPREVILCDITGKLPKDKKVSAAMQVAFDTGKALHDMVANNWLRPMVVGSWRCRACHTITPFSKLPLHRCPKCKEYRWDYVEEEFESVSAGFRGCIDALVDFGTGLHTVVEIKTIDKDQFAELVAPMAEHRLRTNLYLWLIQDSLHPYRESIDPHHAKVLYVSKGFGKKGVHGILPFKEFDVTYNEASVLPYVKLAKQVHYARSKGLVVVPAGVCPTSFVNRVKQCACPQECWSGKYPVAVLE